MAKDSQLDPKPIRKMKAKGGHTMAESALWTARAEIIKSNQAVVINAAMISKKSGALFQRSLFLYDLKHLSVTTNWKV